MLAPAQESALERSEPVLWYLGAAAGKIRENEHTLDVVAAPSEASTYLGGDDAIGRESTNPTFERSEVLKFVHEFYRTASGAKRGNAG